MQIPQKLLLATALMGISPSLLGAARTPETLTAFDGPVGSVVVNQDGSILVAGGRLDYRYTCRIDRPLWSSAMNSHLAKHPDGSILVLADFNTIDGQARKHVGLIDSDGSVDRTFIPWNGQTNPYDAPPNMFRGLANPIPFRIAGIDPQGRFHFMEQVKQPVRGVQRFRIFNADASGRITGPSIPDEGEQFHWQTIHLLNQRGFRMFSPIRWNEREPTDWIETQNPRTAFMSFFSAPWFSAGDIAIVLKRIFSELPHEMCRYAIRLPNGDSILLVQDGSSGRFMRFDKDWLPVPGYRNELRAWGEICLAVQPDGKLLVACATALASKDGWMIDTVTRFHPDGRRDTSFQCRTDERVYSVAVHPDGRILIGGRFRRVNGKHSPGLACLNPNGSLNQKFHSRFTTKAGLNASLLASNSSSSTTTTPDTHPDKRTTTTLGTPLVIRNIQKVNQSIRIDFTGTPSTSYLVEGCDSITDANWQLVAEVTTDAQGNALVLDTGIQDNRFRLYRVKRSTPHIPQRSSD